MSEIKLSKLVCYEVVADRFDDEPEKHRAINGDVHFIAGGWGWEVRRDPRADLRKTRTLRNHVIAFEGQGLYLSHETLNTLGVSSRGLGYRQGRNLPGLRVGNAVFFKFTRELSAEIELAVGYERRNERERFVQERNTGIWNTLLGMAHDYNVEPYNVDARELA